MAKAIAPQTGLVTVWNTTTPLTLGNVYSLRPDGKGGKALFEQYNRFVEHTDREFHGVSSVTPATWSEEITSGWNIKPQLKYMGLQGDAALSNTKAIKFSAQSDTRHNVQNLVNYVDSVLNFDGTGEELRRRVFANTQKLKESNLPLSDSYYWIVTDFLTVKGLSVTFEGKPSASAGLATPDAAKLSTALSQFLSVEGLEASVTADIHRSDVKNSTIKAPESVGLVAMCYPLVGTKDANGKITIDIDTDYPLALANTFK